MICLLQRLYKEHAPYAKKQTKNLNHPGFCFFDWGLAKSAKGVKSKNPIEINTK
jgi:hypothetical protein